MHSSSLFAIFSLRCPHSIKKFKRMILDFLRKKSVAESCRGEIIFGTKYPGAFLGWKSGNVGAPQSMLIFQQCSKKGKNNAKNQCWYKWLHDYHLPHRLKSMIYEIFSNGVTISLNCNFLDFVFILSGPHVMT